jgi:ABC-type protease/lipase transport system fused ATPase/permease subunit
MAAEGSSVIVITHKTSTLAKVDKILVMKDGSAADFGARDQIFKKMQTRKKSEGRV